MQGMQMCTRVFVTTMVTPVRSECLSHVAKQLLMFSHVACSKWYVAEIAMADAVVTITSGIFLLVELPGTISGVTY